MEVEFVGSYSDTGYVNGLLRLALDATVEEYGTFRVTTKPPASDWREVALVTSKPKLNRIAITSKPHEIRDKTNLRMIYVPLMRGSLGFRVCITASDYDRTLQQLFRENRLHNIRFGAGHEWSDIDILRYNGLQVVEAGFDLQIDRAITSLYKMTAHRRVDVFCRGVNEVLSEKNFYDTNSELTLNLSHVIVYDMPFFFYLHPENVALYERLTLGFQRLLETKVWEKYWDENIGESLRFTELESRKVIKLNSQDPFYDTEDYRKYLLF